MSEASQERAIGRVEGQLEIIIAEQAAAANSRRITYEKLDKIIRQMDETDRNVVGLHTRMKAVEEPVAEFSKWRERFIGMGLLVALAAGGIGACLYAIWIKASAIIMK